MPDAVSAYSAKNVVGIPGRGGSGRAARLESCCWGAESQIRPSGQVRWDTWRHEFSDAPLTMSQNLLRTGLFGGPGRRRSGDLPLFRSRALTRLSQRLLRRSSTLNDLPVT